MIKQGVKRRLQLLNPKNLANEVHVYGYHFSRKNHVLMLISTLLGISFIAVLFKMKPLYFSIIIAAVCLMFPMFILNMFRRMFEQKRFADAVTYAEQVLYSFQKNGKVVSALKETKEIFEEGRMKSVLEEAIIYLESGNTNGANGILKEALGKIEQAYNCGKIHIVHELLISGEEVGGDVSNSILLLLNDIELWKRREYTLQANKKVLHRDNVLSIVVATILCVVTLYVLDAMGLLVPGAAQTGIFAMGAIQVSSFLFLLFMLYVLSKSMSGLTKNWLQTEKLYKESYILASYDMVMRNFKEKNNWKRAISAIPLRLAKRDVNNELYLSLPQWLMQMALLLQNNNVQVSLIKSIPDASPVLQRELELMRKRLEEKPNELQSYTEFCKAFDVPEIQSCMKMLHAISESGTGNTTVQINNLLQRVHEMQNTAEDIRSKDEAFQMKLLFSYPVLAATFKLLVDMTVGMMYIFQLLGSVGGI